MSQRRVNETSLTATADALRVKLGTSDPITWAENQGFKAAVESIQTGGGGGGGTDVSGVTATEDDVLEGAVFVNAQGQEKEGTIPRNGDTSATIDGIETKSVEIPAGYTTGGKVELDGTIDNAVEAAKTSLENKGVEVPTDTDVRGLAGLIDSIPETGGGGELQELDVAPSHEVQEFIPAEGVAGYKKVTVKPVPELPAATSAFYEGLYTGKNVFESGVNVSVGSGFFEERAENYAKMSYNGTELAEIPVYYSEYPYRIIAKYTDGQNYAFLSKTPWVHESGNYIQNQGAYGPMLCYDEIYRLWLFRDTEYRFNATSTYVPFWSSHALLYQSSTDIYMEGTEPVPIE